MKYEDLGTTALDASVASLKAAAGAIPLIGSTIAEIVGYSIPRQKLDRIAQFLEVLALKVAHVERQFLRSQMQSELFADLLEDALNQAARALTPERRERIACSLASAIEDATIDHLHKKTLLALLGDLNDIQIVILTYFDERSDREEIARQHRRDDALLYPSPDDGVTPEQKRRWPLQRRYWEHLCELGLLRPKFRVPQPHALPEFDAATGMLPRFPGAYEITSLGQQLVTFIGAVP